MVVAVMAVLLGRRRAIDEGNVDDCENDDGDDDDDDDDGSGGGGGGGGGGSVGGGVGVGGGGGGVGVGENGCDRYPLYHLGCGLEARKGVQTLKLVHLILTGLEEGLDVTRGGEEGVEVTKQTRGVIGSVSFLF